MRQKDKIQELIGDVLRRVPLNKDVSREVLAVLQTNIEKSRATVLNAISREITRVASRVDAQRVMEDLLRNHTIKIEAKITLEPKNKRKRGG